MREAAYDMIDRYLRNNLGDEDYAEYSQALDELSFSGETNPNDEFIGLPVEYQYSYPDGSWLCNYGVPVDGTLPTAKRALYAKKDGT